MPEDLETPNKSLKELEKESKKGANKINDFSEKTCNYFYFVR